MEIFITEKFIDEIIKQKNDAHINQSDDKLATILKVQKLILSGLKINCSIDIHNLPKYFDSTGNKSFNDLKEAISTKAIKNPQLFAADPLISANNIKKYNAYYFCESEVSNFSEKGIVLINDLASLNNFFEFCTVNTRTLDDEDYTIIEEAIPPCTSMLYIDKYLFGSKVKINNFIKFLKLYKKDDLKIPFQLTIISLLESERRGILTSMF